MEGFDNFIKKWESQIQLWRRTIDDPLMYTKEERLKAAAYCQSISAILSDLENLIAEQPKQ